MKFEHLKEEVTWLLSFGVEPNDIAIRLGVQLASIERNYWRNGERPPWVSPAKSQSA